MNRQGAKHAKHAKHAKPRQATPRNQKNELKDFKHGARVGIGSALMKPTVEKLTVEDMLNLAAYAASLAP